MSYQPDDRYWTDYLRVALPAVGLLLMLGLFWFWASSLIGNGGSDAPTTTPKSNVAVVTTVTAPTAAATKPAVVVAPTATPTQAAAQAQPTQATTQQNQTSQPPASTAAASNNTSSTSTASGNSTATAQFSNGETVTTTETVNMRDAPSTNSNVITPLDPGTQLKITGAPQQADGYTWYPVQDVNGNPGYVAGNYLQASGQ